MRYIIKIMIAILPFFTLAQSDTTIYCENRDSDAQPINGYPSLNNIITESSVENDCFNPEARFYYNVIVLKDGTVSMLNLEGVSIKDGKSCIIAIADPSKVQKWIPAVKDGKQCNQKLRIKTYIHFK